MKRFRKALLVFFLLIGLLITVFGDRNADAAGRATVSASSATADYGENVTVNLSLSGNPGIEELTLQVSFDTDALEYVSHAEGGVMNLVIFSVRGGKCTFVLRGDDTSNGTLGSLTFKVKNGVERKDYAIGVSISNVSGLGGEDVSVSGTSGSVKVACKHALTEVRGKEDATTQKEGYTGDVYCKNCASLLSRGEIIPKVTEKATEKVTEKTPVKTTSTKAPSNANKTPSENNETKTTAAKTTETKTTEKRTTETKTTAKNTTVTGTTTVNENAPKIILGPMYAYLIGSGMDLTFESSAPKKDFVSVMIDGKKLKKEHYEVSGENTKVVIKPEALNDMTEGTHKISIVSKQGAAEAEFTAELVGEKMDGERTTVQVATSMAKTPVAKSNTQPWIFVFAVLIVLGGLGIYLTIRNRDRWG